MKKFLMLLLALAAVLSLAACSSKDDASGGQDDDAGADVEVQEPTGSQVTDTEFGTARTHEQLAPQTFVEGELTDNPYYKRSVDPETNRPSYEVILASTGETVYLPFDKTVVYVSETPDVAYLEKVPLSYKLDGEDIETEQYQLTVSGMAISGETDAPVTDDPGQGDVTGGEAVEAPAEPAEAGAAQG